MAGEKKETDRLAEKARNLRTAITVAGFAIGIIGIIVAAYLFIHRNPFSR